MPRDISVQVRVQKIDARLTLVIPLIGGGNELRGSARGIGEVEGENPKIVIPDWLADKLGIEEGALVKVDNAHGKLNLTALEAGPSYSREN